MAWRRFCYGTEDIANEDVMVNRDIDEINDEVDESNLGDEGDEGDACGECNEYEMREEEEQEESIQGDDDRNELNNQYYQPLARMQEGKNGNKSVIEEGQDQADSVDTTQASVQYEEQQPIHEIDAMITDNTREDQININETQAKIPEDIRQTTEEGEVDDEEGQIDEKLLHRRTVSSSQVSIHCRSDEVFSEPHYPTPSLLASLNHCQTFLLISRHLDWLSDDHLPPNCSQWLYSLFLRLDELLMANEISTIRDLCRKIKRIRQSILNNRPNERITEIAGCTVLIVIIADHFGQKDLGWSHLHL